MFTSFWYFASIDERFELRSLPINQTKQRRNLTYFSSLLKQYEIIKQVNIKYTYVQSNGCVSKVRLQNRRGTKLLSFPNSETRSEKREHRPEPLPTQRNHLENKGVTIMESLDQSGTSQSHYGTKQTADTVISTCWPAGLRVHYDYVIKCS